MTGGSDDRLTAARRLAAVLSINVWPGGKLDGTIRDDGHFYRFSGLKGLPAAVLRWLGEVLGPPFMRDVEPGAVDDHGHRPPRSSGEEKPCR
jgi:hypothetical protein